MTKYDITYKFKTYLPIFNGFYNTIFEELLSTENYEEYEKEEGRTMELYENYDVDYEKACQDISLIAIEFVKDMIKEAKIELDCIDCNIEFVKLFSPKEYNYMNDEIHVNIYMPVYAAMELAQIMNIKYESISELIEEALYSQLEDKGDLKENMYYYIQEQFQIENYITEIKK